MLKFYRRIRLKSLDEGNPKMYLIYAIGEVLLVMIGILLALQVNNWKEQIKENETELQYLERLMIDLASDSAYYARKIEESELNIKQLDKYIHEAYETQESIEEVKQLCGHLYLNTDHFAIQNSTYRELTSAGKLNIFKNELLKKSIIDYYRVTEDLGMQIQEFNLVSTEYLVEASRVARNFAKFLPFQSSLYDDPKMILDGEWDFFNNPVSEKFQAIESMVAIYHLRNNEHLTYFYRLNSLSTDLNNQIKEDLDKRSQ